MLISCVIFSWLGLFLFLVLIFIYKQLVIRTEYALIHIIMALIFSFWMPLPTSRDATFNATSDFLFAAISKPFEAIANVFKSIWSLFLGIAFWQSGEHVFASFMFLFSLLIIYYFTLAIKESLLHSNTVLSKFKNNMIFHESRNVITLYTINDLPYITSLTKNPTTKFLMCSRILI
jgi:hypothetical protein